MRWESVYQPDFVALKNAVDLQHKVENDIIDAQLEKYTPMFTWPIFGSILKKTGSDRGHRRVSCADECHCDTFHDIFHDSNTEIDGFEIDLAKCRATAKTVSSHAFMPGASAPLSLAAVLISTSFEQSTDTT